MRRRLFVIPWALLAASTTAGAGEPAVDYARDIKPLLARRCYACHGALKQQVGLRLDTAELIRKGSENGPIVAPGHADESALIEAITGESGFRMPPEGEPLSQEEVRQFRAWIDSGATGPSDERPQPDPARHWSFVPPVRPEVPRVAESEGGLGHPIDAFLAVEQRRLGLSPVPEAEKEVLLRRVSLDLTGLVPTRAELRGFLDDPSDEAYERAVDRLLASPRFGERWGRHWMDVWRYSDWAGYQAEVRESQPHIWRWRDWIVESLNEGKPYDRMVQEMLAADELAPERPEALRATGFLVRNWYKFNRNVWLQATVEHTSKAFLGLTINCARCHDHKYDPISHDDYYRFQAYFQSHDIATDRLPGHPDTAKVGLVRVIDSRPSEPTYRLIRGDEKRPDKDHPIEPGVPAVFGAGPPIEAIPLPLTVAYPALQTYIQEETRKSGEAKITAARAALETARKAEDAARERSVGTAGRLDVSEAERAAAEQALSEARVSAVAAATDLAAALAEQQATRAKIAADTARFVEPRDTKRADILAIQATHAERQAALRVAEAALAHAEHDRSTAKNAQAAQAKLDQAKAALEAARKTAAGAHSTAYTPFVAARPESSSGRRLALARWITSRKNPLTARVAVNHIWMRHFGQPLVATVFDFGSNGKPPTHPALLDWLAVELMESGWDLKHMHRLIVTSRAYRRRSWSGPDDPNSKLDPENRALWRANARRMEAELVRDNVLHIAGNLDGTMGGPELDQQKGLTVFRRSLYFRHANEKVMTFLKIFDSANVNACYRRDESVVPQQALALANSPLALGQARALARRLSAPEQSGAEFVTAAFETVLGRAPRADEAALCLEYLADQARLLADPSKLTAFTEGTAPAVAPSTDPAMRARENLVHVLINHNDFVTIR